jgi:TolA-binding protein
MIGTRYKIVLLTAASTIMLASAMAEPASAAVDGKGAPSASKDPRETAASTLSDVGMSLERARLLPPGERAPALEKIAASAARILDSDMPGERRCAALFLSAEIDFALGRYESAAQRYRKAGDKDREKLYRDDAAAAGIMAMEASGKDGKAAKEWKKWCERYPDSPLMPEVMLARAWNALRRGEIEQAMNMVLEAGDRWPWVANDRRAVIAMSLIAFINGSPGEALGMIEGLDDSPAVVYLRGMCHEDLGETLKAAARYQETAERWPESDLRDPAMFAKADIFLRAGAYRSAAEEMARVSERSRRGDIRDEASLREAVAVYLEGEVDSSATLLRSVINSLRGGTVAARAQFLLGEALFSKGDYQNAIVEYNRVLSDYFEHDLAARAQYRTGRCLDALGRGAEATSAYQAVVSGYPMSSESPAAAYLAGVGLLELGRPLAAAPYFQIVMDRYARPDSAGIFVFASPEHQELVEASLCLLEYSYHCAGDLGQLSGAPHLMLQQMPPSDSPWRAYSVLIDADALASQARYDEAEAMLTGLISGHPSHPAVLQASRLLAWTYAQRGMDEMAIETEEKMLARYAASGNGDHLASAYYNKANIMFNRKEYASAAAAYDEFIRRFPGHGKHFEALYRAGLSYQRLDQNGDAVDRWEELVAADSTGEHSEQALVRAGDLYFRAGHYDDSKRCYEALLERFPQSGKAPLASLRIAQSEYNGGNDEEALRLYSQVAQRYPDGYAGREAQRGMEQALYRLGQQDNGTAVLARLVEEYGSSPFAADAQFEIALRSYNAEDYEKAAEQFRRVTSQFPGYSAADRAHYLLAESYRKAGDARRSGLACEQFLNFFPDSEYRPMVLFRVGSIRFEEEKYMQAAVDFTGVLDEEAPEDIAAASMYNLALCRRMLGETGAARETLERYREDYPSGHGRTADIAYQLGDIHEETGNTEEAIAEYQRALAAEPARDLASELRYRIGSCREQLGDADGAVRAYEKAMANGPKNDPFRLLSVARCAALYEQKEQWKKAISAYRDLIKNSGDDELVLAANERVAQLEAASR